MCRHPQSTVTVRVRPDWKISSIMNNSTFPYSSSSFASSFAKKPARHYLSTPNNSTQRASRGDSSQSGSSIHLYDDGLRLICAEPRESLRLAPPDPSSRRFWVINSMDIYFHMLSPGSTILVFYFYLFAKIYWKISGRDRQSAVTIENIIIINSIPTIVHSRPNRLRMQMTGQTDTRTLLFWPVRHSIAASPPCTSARPTNVNANNQYKFARSAIMELAPSSAPKNPQCQIYKL